MMSYAFNPMTADHLPLLMQWLRAPHVIEWWGEPDEQYALVSGDMAEPAMDQYIVEHEHKPFAYLQCYRLTDWNTGFGEHPEGTRGVDVMIGEASMIGCGHGSSFIREFASKVLAGGAPRVVTDPDPVNARAIRAYEKAGFRKERLVDTPDGESLLMVRNP